MNLLLRMYRLALSLYPARFRALFAAEMEEVFAAGLQDSLRRGIAWRFLLAEALHLPASLTDVYSWALTNPGGERLVFSSAGGGAPLPAGSGDRRGWGESVLAGLPNLILGLMVIFNTLSSQSGTLPTQVVMILSFGVILLPALAVVLFSLRKGWRLWSASWLVYVVFILLGLVSILFGALFPVAADASSAWSYNILIVVLPLALAYLCYKVACQDALRGLLVTLPLMTVPWTFFSEFVPAGANALAWLWLCLVAFSAAVGMMRARRFGVALALGLALPLLGGFPFTWLGVYQGGTLPFSLPGPSLNEVLRQHLPFVVGMVAIGLGPQLAIHVRAYGRMITGAGSRAYRLILGGVLLALGVVLLTFVFYTTTIVGRMAQVLQAAQQAGTILAAGLYLAGFALLARAGQRSGLFDKHPDAAGRLAGLFLLLPGVPLAVLWAMPDLQPCGLASTWLLYIAEYAWVVAAAWLVRGGLPARQG